MKILVNFIAIGVVTGPVCMTVTSDQVVIQDPHINSMSMNTLDTNRVPTSKLRAWGFGLEVVVANRHESALKLSNPATCISAAIFSSSKAFNSLSKKSLGYSVPGNRKHVLLHGHLSRLVHPRNNEAHAGNTRKDVAHNEAIYSRQSQSL